MDILTIGDSLCELKSLQINSAYLQILVYSLHIMHFYSYTFTFSVEMEFFAVYFFVITIHFNTGCGLEGAIQYNSPSTI